MTLSVVIREYSYIQTKGMLKGTVENNPCAGTKILFEGVARNFSPIRGTNSITTIFRLNTIKNTAKVPAVNIVKLNIEEVSKLLF